MSSATSVLVLGAGELGLAVLRAFASKPETAVDITVLLRPSTASRPRTDTKVAPIYNLPRPVKFLSCDLLSSSQSELAEAFKPYDVVIGCTGYDQNSAGTGAGLQSKIARAVLETGTVKLYLPWQFGVDYDQFDHDTAGGLFSEQKDVRTLLRNAVSNGETHTKWLIVSTGIFMSYLFSEFWGVVQRDGETGWVVNALNSWDTAVTVTTPDDIGKVTCAIVTFVMRNTPDSKSLFNSSVYIAGDTVTYGQLYDIVREVSEKPVRRGEELKMTTLEKSMSENLDDILRKYRVAFGRGKGVAWDKSTAFNYKHGIEVQSAKEWFQHYIATL